MKRRQLLGSLGKVAGLACTPAVPWLAACGPRQPRLVDFSEAAHTYQPTDYPAVLQRWTRHARLVRDIGTVLEFWATYKSWDFRQAYVESYGDAYGLRESDRRTLRQSQMEAARGAYEFHLIAQSTEYKWNDLEQQDSVWKISLADAAGRELVPSSVAVEKLPEQYEMRFFPARTYFSRTFTVKFPRAGAEADTRFSGPSSGRLALRISGPLGKLEASWIAG